MSQEKLKSAVIGALAGLITGILIAPRSGKETREVVKKKYDEIHDDIAEKLSKTNEITRETFSDIVGDVLDSYKKKGKLGEDEAEEVKKSLKESFEKIKKNLDDRE